MNRVHRMHNFPIIIFVYNNNSRYDIDDIDDDDDYDNDYQNDNDGNSDNNKMIMKMTIIITTNLLHVLCECHSEQLRRLNSVNGRDCNCPGPKFAVHK